MRRMTESMERSLDESLDYRDFLADYFRWRKSENRRFSYRVLATRLDLDVAHVHRILNKRRHLSVRAVPRVGEVLGLDGHSIERLELLVRYARCRSEARRAALRNAIAGEGGSDFPNLRPSPREIRIQVAA